MTSAGHDIELLSGHDQFFDPNDNNIFISYVKQKKLNFVNHFLTLVMIRAGHENLTSGHENFSNGHVIQVPAHRTADQSSEKKTLVTKLQTSPGHIIYKTRRYFIFGPQ